jgi:hypothetical protein
MIRRLLVTFALLLALDTAGAVRVIEQVERAVELTLAELTLPTGEGSTVSFSECPDCGTSTHRLTDATVLKANGQTLPLAEFVRVASEIRGRANGDNAVAVVFLDIATSRITRIEVRE